MKVLVIDDNAVNRRYVKSVIEQEGIEVFTAKDGVSGISLAAELNPDSILVDIQMPDMDGFECLESLKKVPNLNAPILAITAYSNPEDRDKFIAKGFQDYITKPVKPNVLSSTINYWLKNSEKKEQQSTLVRKQEFDMAAKDELLKHIDPVGVQELYKQFEVEINEFMSNLQQLNSSKNFYNICSILHTIKGNAGSLGFFELSEMASELEENTKLGDTNNLEQDILDLKAYTQQLFYRYETHFN